MTRAQALVRCIPDSRDRRAVLVVSTPKGRAALQEGLVRTLEQLAALLNKLDAAELDAMDRVIRQAREGNAGN